MRRAGFTLLEAVVALAIIGLVSVGALSAYAAEARAAQRARETAPAAVIARERLSRLSLLDAHGLRAVPDSLRRGALTAGGASYDWTANAHPVPGEMDLYDLAVDVQWATGSYALRTRTYRPAAGGAR